MKINLNIDENERRRILEMHQSAVKNHYLTEQSSTVYTFSGESLPARLFIYKEFNLFKFNPNFATMSNQEQIDALNTAKQKLTTTDMNALVQKAVTEKVSTESILALQEDLKKVSGNSNLTFVGTDGTEKSFVDGKLGTNTVKALLDYQTYLLGLGKSTSTPSKIASVEPGSAKTAIQGTYNVGQK